MFNLNFSLSDVKEWFKSAWTSYIANQAYDSSVVDLERDYQDMNPIEVAATYGKMIKMGTELVATRGAVALTYGADEITTMYVVARNLGVDFETIREWTSGISASLPKTIDSGVKNTPVVLDEAVVVDEPASQTDILYDVRPIRNTDRSRYGIENTDPYNTSDAPGTAHTLDYSNSRVVARSAFMSSPSYGVQVDGFKTFLKRPTFNTELLVRTIGSSMLRTFTSTMSLPFWVHFNIILGMVSRLNSNCIEGFNNYEVSSRNGNSNCSNLERQQALYLKNLFIYIVSGDCDGLPAEWRSSILNQISIALYVGAMERVGGLLNNDFADALSFISAYLGSGGDVSIDAEEVLRDLNETLSITNVEALFVNVNPLKPYECTNNFCVDIALKNIKPI